MIPRLLPKFNLIDLRPLAALWQGSGGQALPGVWVESGPDRVQQVAVQHLGDGERQVVLVAEQVLPRERGLEALGLKIGQGLLGRQCEMGRQLEIVDEGHGPVLALDGGAGRCCP